MEIFRLSQVIRMKHFSFFYYIFFVLSTSLFSQTETNYYPRSIEYIKSDYYTFSYNEDFEQANWVYYRLNEEIINGNAVRKNNFKEDPRVLSGSARLSDYKGSEYDRGHLCPAGSMKISQKAMDQTFYMSNMSPQTPSFNRGIWKKLEGLIRNWVEEYGELLVVTGPIFDKNMSTIGQSEVAIPNFFYKVIYATKGEGKMIGFILPNKKSDNDLSTYSTTVDEVEEKTGLDFYYQMDDKKESELEKYLSPFKFN